MHKRSQVQDDHRTSVSKNIIRNWSLRRLLACQVVSFLYFFFIIIFGLRRFVSEKPKKAKKCERLLPPSSSPSILFSLRMGKKRCALLQTCEEMSWCLGDFLFFFFSARVFVGRYMCKYIFYDEYPSNIPLALRLWRALYVLTFWRSAHNTWLFFIKKPRSAQTGLKWASKRGENGLASR